MSSSPPFVTTAVVTGTLVLQLVILSVAIGTTRNIRRLRRYQERLLVKPGEEPDAREVHCFVNPAPSMIVGADWSLDQVLDCLRRSAEAGELAEAGPEARRLGHTIRALDRPGKIVWFEARDVR